MNEKGKLSLGICASNGVVLATHKHIPALADPTNYHKIMKVTNNSGVVYAGMGPDYRVLLNRARKRSQVYYMKYKDLIPTEGLTKQVAQVMQEFTQQGGVRPFGVSLLIGGFDHKGPQLFQADPSGAYFQWKATAIGKGYQNARAFLEKNFRDPSEEGEGSDDFEVADAIDLAIRALQSELEGQMTEDNIEIGIVERNDKGVPVFNLLSPEAIKRHIGNMNL